MEKHTQRLLELLQPGFTFRKCGESAGLFTFERILANDGRYMVIRDQNNDPRVELLAFLDMCKIEIPFLDYLIVNSGNSDGWVITKSFSTPGYKGYETNLGNFGTLDSAKEWSIRYFLIARPEIFAHTVCNKMIRKGSGTVHEYYRFVDCAKGLPGVEEITSGDGTNMLISFNGGIV